MLMFYISRHIILNFLMMKMRLRAGICAKLAQNLLYFAKLCNIAVIEKVSETIVLIAIIKFISCDGRVVKALDLKSNGVSPRRFESCSQRQLFFFLTPFDYQIFTKKYRF